MSFQRINKILSICGECLRRKSEKFITEGKVLVNGFNLEIGIKNKIFKKKLRVQSRINDSEIDPFFEIGNIIKEARIQKKLTEQDLSYISKVPLSTIKAIENNQRDLIPKYPFIRSILIKMEECLSIKKFKLVNLLGEEQFPIKNNKKHSFIINRLDIINSWQGSLIYVFILLISILILNFSYTKNKVIEFKYIEKSISK